MDMAKTKASDKRGDATIAMNKRARFRETDEELPAGFALLGAFPNDCVMSTARIRAALGFAELMTPEEHVSDLVSALRASRANQSSGRSK